MSKSHRQNCECFKCTERLREKEAARKAHLLAEGGLVHGAAEPPPVRIPEDFKGADFDFTVGEVYGLRVWRIDDFGRLRALHVQTAAPWRPGINEAACIAEHDGSQVWYSGGLIMTVPGSYTYYSTGANSAKRRGCKRVPNEKCRCGFYAYTSISHTELSKAQEPDHILGMVRGSGRTLIGSKGFRSEKAEVVALLDPTHLPELRRRAVLGIYPDVPLMADVDALLQFAPLTSALPEVDSEAFWAIP